MASDAPVVSTPGRPPTWPWFLFGVVAVGLFAADIAVALQYSAGLAHPYGYWLEGTLGPLAYALVGATICSRVPGNLLGPTMLGVGVLGAVQSWSGLAAVGGVAAGWPPWAYGIPGGVFGAVQARGVGLVVLTLMLAPNGHPLTPRWRWPITAYLGLLVVSGVSALFIGPDPQSLDGYPQGQGIPLPAGTSMARLGEALGNLALFTGIAFACISLALRWFRTSGLERQRVSWVVWGGLAGPVIIFVDTVLTLWVTGTTEGSWLSGTLVWAVAAVALPVGIAIAVFRHGLYDLDRVLSRTVSYTLVTGMIIALYTITVTAASSLFQTSDHIAVAAATLAAAAVVRPLLRRVQDAVDRRFDRSAYDAALAVEEFSLTLGREVDLQTIQSSLTDVVDTTLRPTKISLYLRKIN